MIVPMRGCADASVLGWRAFGIFESKQLKARHPSTNPYYPYRFRRFTIHDFRFTILNLVEATALGLIIDFRPCFLWQ